MDTLRFLALAFVCGLLSTPTFSTTAAEPIVKPATYDVSESLVSISPPFGSFELSFTGRFTFNPNGTGLCSALVCAPGVIPDFTNVSMSGTATNFPAWGPNVHGQIALEEIGNTLTFYNFNGFSVLTSSASDLLLTLTSPLGGSVTNIAPSFAQYEAFGSPRALATCGINATCSGSVGILGHEGPQTNLVTRLADATVPEPGTFSLLALALAGLGTVRMRRRWYGP